MRILHVNQFGDLRGGAEAYIAEVAAALGESGHSSHLLYLAPGAGDLLPATTEAPLGEWPAPIDGARCVIEQVLSTFQPDVAFLHMVYHPDLIEWLSAALPTVAYVHSPYPVCPGSGQYLRKTSRVCPHRAGLICLVNAQTERCCWGRNPARHIGLLRRAGRFVEALGQVGAILVAGAFMKQLLERGGIPGDHISTLPPVMLPASLPEGEDGAGPSQMVLYAGRLTPEKGLAGLITALASVDGDWQLVVAGEGTERQVCESLARSLGVADKVRFLGWTSDEELRRCYRQAACVALPSLWPEPFGRVGSEAFYNARPVVAYASGGIPDWLRNEEFGYLVPTGDTDRLGQSIGRLLNSPSLRRDMGLKARAYAVERWDRCGQVDRLVTHFTRAVEAFPGTSRRLRS